MKGLRRGSVYIQWNITQLLERAVTCSNMDGPRDYHTKQSKSEKKGQIPYNVTYMWILKYKSN